MRLIVAVSASRDNCVRLDLAEVARFVLFQIAARSIWTKQLKVVVQRVARPPLASFAARILRHRGVLDERHVAATLNQTTERSRVAIVILRGVATTIAATRKNKMFAK